jgi:hypothetical protein
MFGKKKKGYNYELDAVNANAVLQNVFAASHQQPNTIPFDKLVLRQPVDEHKFTRSIRLAAALLIITLIMPMAVIPLTRAMAPKAIVLVSDEVQGDILRLGFDGDGLEYHNAYIYTAANGVEYAVAYNPDTKTIDFPYHSGETMNIYIRSTEGNLIHFLLIPEDTE